MLPDRVSNPGPLTYESGALPIALRGPAHKFWFFTIFQFFKFFEYRYIWHDIFMHNSLLRTVCDDLTFPNIRIRCWINKCFSNLPIVELSHA